MGMRVGELARRTGVGVSTLRAWEHRYRFPQPERSASGHRLYAEDDVERVIAVQRLVGEGLTLPGAIARVAHVGSGAAPGGEAEALLYGQILQAVGQGVWVVGHGRTHYANTSMARLMRCTVEDLLAFPVLDLLPPDDLPVVRERQERARAGQVQHFTQELRRPDGSAFLAEMTTTPLFNHAGRYEVGVAIVSDVTTRHEELTQARLRASLLDAVGEAVAAATPDQKLVYVNAAAERLFGWRSADVLGRNGLEVFAAPEAAKDAVRLHRSLVKGKRYAGGFVLSRQDGRPFDAQLTSSPVHDEQGALIGVVAVIRDQTEARAEERKAERRGRQSETLALLGAQALRQRMDRNAGVELVRTEVVQATRRLLGADQALVLDASRAGELLVTAASPSLPIGAVVPSGSRSFPGYITLARKVVLVHDAARDGRFDPYAPSPDCPSTSAIGAPIFGPDGIAGVLTAASAHPDNFDHDDAHFIQGMANVMGVALLD